MAIGRSGDYERNPWCCGGGGGCDDGFTQFDGEGTTTAQLCWGDSAYKICCVDDNYEPGLPPPPLSEDELTVQRIDPGHCPYAASADDLHGTLHCVAVCTTEYATTVLIAEC